MLKPLGEMVMEVAGHVRTIDARSACEEIKANGGLLVDVREPGEVELRAAGGTLNVPRGVLEIKLPELYPDPDTPIYLHCATGGRARLSADQLHRMGYRNVTAVTCNIDVVCEIFGHG